MVLGKVVGTVVTTVSHRDFKNRRLLVVQPLGLEGEKPDDDFIALDNTQAGIGDTVLVNREGNGASRGFSPFLSGSPILAASALRSFVIGIVELPAINP